MYRHAGVALEVHVRLSMVDFLLPRPFGPRNETAANAALVPTNVYGLGLGS